MTFKQYLRSLPLSSSTPQGDFLMDARADRQFPSADTWTELELYLMRRNACEGAIKAGHTLWRSYLRREHRRRSV